MSQGQQPSQQGNASLASLAIQLASLGLGQMAASGSSSASSQAAQQGRTDGAQAQGQGRRGGGQGGAPAASSSSTPPSQSAPSPSTPGQFLARMERKSPDQDLASYLSQLQQAASQHLLPDPHSPTTSWTIHTLYRTPFAFHQALVLQPTDRRHQPFTIELVIDSRSMDRVFLETFLLGQGGGGSDASFAGRLENRMLLQGASLATIAAKASEVLRGFGSYHLFQNNCITFVNQLYNSLWLQSQQGAWLRQQGKLPDVNGLMMKDLEQLDRLIDDERMSRIAVRLFAARHEVGEETGGAGGAGGDSREAASFQDMVDLGKIVVRNAGKLQHLSLAFTKTLAVKESRALADWAAKAFMKSMQSKS